MESIIHSVVNIISLCAAFISLSSIIILMIYRRQVLNRVTLRFQGLIALIDIAKHITLLEIAEPGGTACLFIGFFRFFIDHIYIFTNVLISLNIQLIYIHDLIPKPCFEFFYILVVTGFALVIDLIPFAYGAYGENFKKFCFLKNPHPLRLVFKIFLLYVTVIPGLLYCILISVLVVISLYRQNHFFEEKFPSKQVTIFGETLNGRNFIKKLYLGMSLYPISSVISFLPYIASNIYHDVKGIPVPGEMFFILLFCKRLAGLMNFISLIFDPHFQIAVSSIYKNGFIYGDSQTFDVNLKGLDNIKNEDEEYLINFPGEESVIFEDYIKFL